jgi:hypothetical protein
MPELVGIVGMTLEEANVEVTAEEDNDCQCEDDDPEFSDMPELFGQGTEDSNNEAEEDEPSGVAENTRVQEQHGATDRPYHATAGQKHWDDIYEWNFMNISVKSGHKSFGDVASKACCDELEQLFKEKRALVPVSRSI